MTTSSTIDHWKRRVDALMQRDYAIDTSDAGLGEEDLARYFAEGETPEDFVRWFGGKYDLDRYDSYLLGTLSHPSP